MSTDEMLSSGLILPLPLLMLWVSILTASNAVSGLAITVGTTMWLRLKYDW